MLHRFDEFPRLEALEYLAYLRLRQIAFLLQLFRPNSRVSALLDYLVHQQILRRQALELNRLVLFHGFVHQNIPVPEDLQLALRKQRVNRDGALTHRDVPDRRCQVVVGNALGMQRALLENRELGHRGTTCFGLFVCISFYRKVKQHTTKCSAL